MKYFDISTIKTSIERLQDIKANWLLPAFVFAANNVGLDEFVDLSKCLGTDQFLDRYFHGSRIGLEPLERGNNLLRPRLSGVTWQRGAFAEDYVIQQDTKMWGNLFSSRGYREMRLEGLIEGDKALTRLTDAFQPRFEQEVPETFRFEDFLTWLFAFEGFPDEISSWEGLYNHLLREHLHLTDFKAPYKSRFRLSNPPLPWPTLLDQRPTNDSFLGQLAPKLYASLNNPKVHLKSQETSVPVLVDDELGDDDPVLTEILLAIQAKESLAFLLAGAPGTGKTRYARRLANKLSQNDEGRILFLQFHPALGYEDFMQGFRPVDGKDGNVSYKLEDGVFLDFADKAKKDPERQYVVVIDELTRGDVARIFGEALTYLEVDYRSVSFTLPSGKETSIPRNIIFLATANPYDRSVTDLDDALLRRFWVIEIDPDDAVLRSHLQTNGVDRGLINRTVQVFNVLNRAFPHGYGHANFLRIRTLEDLSKVWSGRVRLALRRVYLHEKAAYEATCSEIDALLTPPTETEAATVEATQGNG